MTPAALAGYVSVPVFGVLLCTTPAVTRPTLQFGVRIPSAHTAAAVIRREKRAYYWRSAAVAVCCAAAAVILWGSGSRWLPRIIVLAEVDDDRFWKAGLVYVNRSDPAIMVAARIGVGWTLNLGNPAAWLVIAVILATMGGLAVIRIAAGG